MKLIEHTTTIGAPPTTPGGGRGRRSEDQPTASPAAIGALLVGRTFGFALFQTLIAAYYAAAGVADPWSRSVAWWPWTAIITSLLTLAALRSLLRREGLRYRDMVRIERSAWRGDAAVAVLLAAVSVPLAVAPNIGLGILLYGDPQAPLDLFVQSLPVWAAAGALLLFPVTVAASELPMYAGYLRPRLEALIGRPRLAVGLVAGWLAVQHATLPLVFDWRFAAWRALMFVPFAVFAIAVLRWRPRLLPYLVAIHLIADLGAVAQVWAAS